MGAEGKSQLAGKLCAALKAAVSCWLLAPSSKARREAWLSAFCSLPHCVGPQSQRIRHPEGRKRARDHQRARRPEGPCAPQPLGCCRQGTRSLTPIRALMITPVRENRAYRGPRDKSAPEFHGVRDDESSKLCFDTQHKCLLHLCRGRPPAGVPVPHNSRGAYIMLVGNTVPVTDQIRMGMTM